MLKRSEDFNETRCPHCTQNVPINRDGKIVTHYRKFKAGSGKGRKQELCKGSGVGAR